MQMSTDAKRYYAVLGVDPASSDEEIRVAFRRRAKDLHPDAGSGDANAFILLKRAYDTLSDPDRRADYDRTCEPPAEPPPEPRWPPPDRVARAMQPLPMPMVKPPRRGGIGIGRYVIAFIVMAAISLGAIQAMISFTEAPPSIRTRDMPAANKSAGPDTLLATPAETPAAPGSSKSGFWDPTPAPSRPKTP